MSDPQKLIADCLEDALSDTQRDALVAWLKAHPDHLSAFVEANIFEQHIRHAVHGQVQREAAMHLVEAGHSLQPEPRRMSEEIPRSWLNRLWLRLVTAGAVARAMALAACFVVLAAGYALWLKRPSGKGTTSTAVAMLTRAVDARWGQSNGPLRVGGALEPGWLRLESGLAQVVFYSGARVVMEGPTELRLVSPSEAVCPSGRLLSEVPQPARGFRLKTDQLSVVDLGTSFGIDASHGRTEVHVFQGKVEVLSGSAAKQPLGEGQAAVAQESTPLRLMATSTAAFTAMFEFQQRSLASEAFRYEQWQFARAQLNQDPSLVVHLDFENLRDADWTLRNAAEKNRAVPEATIVGCQRAEGRWREKQALEFQSVNDRVRLAVPGDLDALTLSAWVCVKGLDRQFNSLFMCDGFEPGTIHWLIRNDGALGLTVFGAGSGDHQILASPPALTLDKFGMWMHLAVVLDGKTRQMVHYVNGVRVSRHALNLGPPFRLGPAELGNWNARSGPNPAPSLIRNLSGSLDEFDLFSRALSDAEVRELYAKGQPDP
jgi:ferric-dicitrate binding protein FerR (iron transport regulator)